MSSGAIFRIIANSGKSDALITANDLLLNRIRNIGCMRAARGIDPTPILADIEETHVLFVNAHFKPFVALAYEYNRVKANNGNSQFGGTVQFSIPNFGDFFKDMVINANLSAISATVGQVPNFPAFIGASDQVTTTTKQTSGLINTTTGVYTKYTQEYVDINGVPLAVGSPATNFVRYCEYPGQRLLRKVSFSVNNNPLDEYTTDVVNFYQKFSVSAGKFDSWRRMMGQEIPIQGYTDLRSIQGNTGYGTAASNVTDVTGTSYVGARQSAATTARKLVQIVTGPQTPALVQPALDLWIPLLFWFCDDVRLSIPSVCIPFGQRFIDVDISAQSEMVFLAPGNLSLRITVETQTSAGAGRGTAAAVAVQNVSKYITTTPVLAANSVVNTTQLINAFDLYINNIFLSTEIHNIYIKRIGFYLIRVNRIQTSIESTQSVERLLNNMKWPIEYMYVACKPVYNVDANNPNKYRDWHMCSLLTNNTIDVTTNTATDVMTDDTVAYNDTTSAKHKTNFVQNSVETVTYPVGTLTIDSISIEAHSNILYMPFKSNFFRDYMSYTYGGLNINSARDEGVFMINFCLFPGTYQPSGHVNVSRAREFYIKISSKYISPSSQVQLIVCGKAINFLLVSDGSALLRYNT